MIVTSLMTISLNRKLTRSLSVCSNKHLSSSFPCPCRVFCLCQSRCHCHCRLCRCCPQVQHRTLTSSSNKQINFLAAFPIQNNNSIIYRETHLQFCSNIGKIVLSLLFNLRVNVCILRYDNDRLHVSTRP